jgi:uncharacterized protein YgiM (DUF1202 family)
MPMNKTIYLMITAFILLFATLVQAEHLAVSANIANIRSGPGTKHDVLWQVEKYYPIEPIEKKGKWYHFRDFENDEGWVHESLIQKMDAVISKKEKCNVRSGPGAKYDVVFTVEKGIPFKVLKRKGNWINIEHADGDKGWIYKTLVW